MSGTTTLLQLGGYVALLLWGTHMVTTGVERGFGAELRLWLGRTLSRPGRWMRFYAMLGGLAVTAVLQSSTATGLMVTSFAARGGIDLAPALAVMLGASTVYVLQVGRIESPLAVPTRPWEVGLVAFEIARRHRFHEEMSSLPSGVRVHVLPTGGDRLPPGTAQFRYRDKNRVGQSIERAYVASASYLSALTG